MILEAAAFPPSWSKQDREHANRCTPVKYKERYQPGQQKYTNKMSNCMISRNATGLMPHDYLAFVESHPQSAVYISGDSKPSILGVGTLL